MMLYLGTYGCSCVPAAGWKAFTLKRIGIGPKDATSSHCSYSFRNSIGNGNRMMKLRVFCALREFRIFS